MSDRRRTDGVFHRRGSRRHGAGSDGAVVLPSDETDGKINCAKMVFRDVYLATFLRKVVMVWLLLSQRANPYPSDHQTTVPGDYREGHP